MPTIGNNTIEIIGSRRTKVSVEDVQQELLFIVSGSDDDAAIIPFVEAQLQPLIIINSVFLGPVTAVLQNYEVNHRGNGIWDGVAHYGKRQPRLTGQVWFAFDGTAGSAHQLYSKETINVYDQTGETDVSFGSAVGVNDQTIDGVDVPVPIFKFTLTYYCPTALITQDYLDALDKNGGKTNDDTWQIWDKGEVLYLGTVGQPRGYDDWELIMHFTASKNEEGLQVGSGSSAIGNIDKGGNEYLWVRFYDKKDSIGNILTKSPQYVIVERMFDDFSFDDLGLPQQWQSVGW